MYFFKVIFSFNITLEAKIVITIELEVITDTVDTCPSIKLNLWHKLAPKSSRECSKKYFFKLILEISKFSHLFVNKQYHLLSFQLELVI